MSATKSALRLGPLPRSELVKLTIQLPEELKRTLDRYAAVHSHVHKESIDVATLIPHMLGVFMDRDRGFRKLERLVPDLRPSALERAA
jgi:hypothetical protein